MEKISITLDLSKVDKTRIVPRTYTNKDNEQITSKDYKVEMIPLKEKKLIKEGDGWKMYKTHFVVQAQTKEERENKTPSVFLGDGFQFERADEPDMSPF